jgi:hypothetical protein
MATTRRDARDAALLAIGTALARKEVDLLKLEREIGRLKAERLRLSDERNPVTPPNLPAPHLYTPPEPAPHTYTPVAPPKMVPCDGCGGEERPASSVYRTPDGKHSICPMCDKD